jgi:uncharacterized protein (TIGR03000 family)
MFKSALLFAKSAVLATAIVLTVTGESQAQHRGRGGWGGGGWGGHRGSYYGGYGGYYGGYRGGWGWGAYPYYGYGGGYYRPYYGTPYYYPDYVETPIVVSPVRYASYYPSDAINGNTATVQVTVPADAEVWFGNHKTSQTGTLRQFESPPLTPGQTYTYDVTASWMSNGQPVTQTRQVQVQGGKRSLLNFMQ